MGAGKSTISITFKLDGDAKGFKDLAKDADGLRSAMQATVVQAEQLQARIINFAALTAGIDQVQKAFMALESTAKDLSSAYEAQETAERKLENSMRNTMDATAEDIQAIKDLCSAQQELGVVGDEVQLAGAQEMATYLQEKRSLETLIPVMNDMLAQQYGLNATQENAAQIASMLGKVMNGQIGALSRYGYTFDEAQAEILKFGTESERASVLADVVGQSVGGMNAALAKTDTGKMKQLDNTIGDIKEQLGKMIQPAQNFLIMGVNATNAAGNVVKLSQGIGTASKAVGTWIAGVKASAMAMKGATVQATALNVATRAIPFIGIATAITAVVGILSTLNDKAEETTVAAEELKQATDAYTDAAAKAKTTIDNEAKKLGTLIREHKDTAQAVAQLNREYGNAFGQHKTAADWYDVLTNKSRAYVKQLGYEAQAKLLASKIAAKDIEREQGRNQAEDMRRNGTATHSVKRLRNVYQGSTGQKTLKFVDVEENTEAYQKVIDANAQLDREIEALQDQLGIAQTRMEECAREMQTVTDAAEPVKVYAMTWQEVSDAMAETEKQLKNTTDPKQIATLKAYNAQLKARKAILEEQLGLGSGHQTTPGKPTKDATPQLPEKLDNVKAYGEAINYWRKVQETANREEYAAIQKTIEALEAERDAFTGVQRASKQEAEEYKPKGIEKLHTIKELEAEIAYYSDLQGKQSVDEIQATQRTIEALQAKKKALQIGIELPRMQVEADEINALSGRDFKIQVKGIGFEELTDRIKKLQAQLNDLNNPVTDAQRKDIESLIATYESWRGTLANSFDTFKSGWDGVKGIGSSIESITEAIEGDGNAWQKTTAIIDGFIQLYEGIQTIVGIVNLLSAATTAHTTAKAAEAAAVTAEATAEGVNAGVSEVAAAAEIPVIAANKLATASYMELAAAEYMAAHAYIPFAGFGIAAGFTTAAVAMVEAIGAMPFADGGVIYGPTLGLMGEYSGASHNPEVVAPLNKLRDLIREPGAAGGEIEFRIKGRELVGILNKEGNIKSRT